MMHLGWKFTRHDGRSFYSFRGGVYHYEVGNSYRLDGGVLIAYRGLHAAYTLKEAAKVVQNRYDWLIEELPLLFRVAGYIQNPGLVSDLRKSEVEERVKFCTTKLFVLAQIDYKDALLTALSPSGYTPEDLDENGGNIIYDEIREEDFMWDFKQLVKTAYIEQYPDLYNLELRHRTFSI